MVTTPPVPSSSPLPTSDSMDISPLPHKPAFSRTIEIQLQTSTPELIASDSSMLSEPQPIEPPAFQFPQLTLLQE